jgi:hypoxanthine phosphoribosyltransferase
MREIYDHELATTEIFYAPKMDIEGQHVLLCVGLLSTGLTTEFLVRTYQAQGAASVSICALLDRPSDRRVDLPIAYHGFQIGPQRLAGFGLGTPLLGRNRPFIFTAADLLH